MPDKKENNSRKSKFWPDWSGEKAKVFLLCVIAIMAFVAFTNLFRMLAYYSVVLESLLKESDGICQFWAVVGILLSCYALAVCAFCVLSRKQKRNIDDASLEIMRQIKTIDGGCEEEHNMENIILEKNPDREKETEIKKFTDAELETLLGNITADCNGECANCEHSHGTEFECDILPMCAEALSQLLSEKKRLESEKNDALEMLHAYRHVCVDMTPERVGELTRADKEGRCIILPEEQGKEVR